MADEGSGEIDFEAERLRDEQRHYLADFLTDEFRGDTRVRIRIVPFARLRPEEDGVMLRTDTREYFFPTEWMAERKLTLIQSEVARIRSGLSHLD